jgi:hypothetical protein
MVWLIIAIPAVAVLVGIAMLAVSMVHYDGLVSDDYYKKGLGINKIIARSQEAVRLGIEAEIVFDQELDILSVAVIGNNAFIAPRKLTLNFRHATRSGFDRLLALDRSATGRYLSTLPDLVAGKWYLELEGDSWKLSTTMQFPIASDLISLKAIY